MASTPPSAEALTAPTSSHDERTKRNVACVNCRNSKVRCKTSHVLGQPCQRCAKLELACVVDKAHKRVTKRSKLEQLEQEVRAIQQAVHPKPGEASWTPPSPRPGFSASSSDAPALPASTNPVSALAQPPTTLHAPVVPLPTRPKIGPTQGRMLNEHSISGDDVDYYFAKFLQHFHPFLPILRKKEPDECFQAQPMLFWVILYVASRRYSRSQGLSESLVSHVSKTIWSMLSIPALGLEEIHALLFVCAWPFPTVRFATDPSPMLAAVAMNAASLLGLHTGRGSNPQFCVGLRNPLTSTDDEAAATWAACCVLAQRASTYVGHPPPCLHFVDGRCQRQLEATTQWVDLSTLYNFQRFLNRFHAAVFAQVSASNAVPETMLAMWELELELLRPSLIRYDTEISRFVSLASMLEIQLYYFQGQPMTPPHQLNALKAFHTARSLVLGAVDLEARRQFVTHATHSTFRSLADAACTVVYLLHSVWAPPVAGPDDANALAQQAWATLKRCAVADADLPSRVSLILETFWRHRESIPLFDVAPPPWLERGGAGLTYGCLERFKASMLSVQNGSEGLNKALKMIHPSRVDPTARGTAGSLPEPSSDPFQDVDWNMLMDDFGWVGNDGVLLGLI